MEFLCSPNDSAALAVTCGDFLFFIFYLHSQGVSGTPPSRGTHRLLVSPPPPPAKLGFSFRSLIRDTSQKTNLHTLHFPELKKVPSSIPPDIIKLDMSYNKINQLRPKEFEDVHELKKLNLSSNGIEFIDPGKSHCMAAFKWPAAEL